jgi:hypothetical protein
VLEIARVADQAGIEASIPLATWSPCEPVLAARPEGHGDPGRGAAGVRWPPCHAWLAAAADSVILGARAHSWCSSVGPGKLLEKVTLAFIGTIRDHSAGKAD